ncbi:lysozyme [Massilia sp. HP4]|uniref:lysozyme n=1 Tax=Massilia sp. HP4 TaxID=2562316 RepID=UPI0010C047AB|nr:lysozyme [Massilia sp. HP4]
MRRAGLAGIVGAVAAAALLVITPKFEGTELTTYRDMGGVLTYCTGATEHAQWGKTYTPEQCRTQLDHDLARHALGIARCVPLASMTDGQRVAFVDAAYNIGVGNFCGSSMARRANAGDMTGACNALLAWNKVKVWRQVIGADGKPVKDTNGQVVMRQVLEEVRGLTRRRQAERELCLRGLP